MANTEKLTKAQKFDLILEALETSIIEEEQKDIIVKFVEAEKLLLAKRVEKERERAQKKREESDILREQVFELLTEEPQTVTDILVALQDNKLTPQKIIARLTALFKEGRIEKALAHIDGKKVMTYKLA